MPKQMLINTVQGQECRIAIVSDEGLEELYVERTSTASRVGNIYKARVTNVEAAIQAAFVDIGLGKNGFLHISDVNPTYFPRNKRTVESVGQKRSHHYRPPIQECLRRGQEVVVQMIKEGIGTKGPTMTTYLSIPGRLLVMMPGMSRLGVSRKVEDEDARDKARSALGELVLPPDMGFIVRTAGIDRPKRELQRDLNYLLRLWKAVKQQIKRARTPSEIYQESDLVTRTIRDVYSAEIERIVCDSPAVARQVEQFLSVAVPRGKHSVELYTGREGLYYESGLEAEIEKIHARRVEMQIGGSLIFDQAEALVAIDVNSGRFRQHSDAETTALKINLQAAKEIARQLRLRDMGGVIIIDFIDMREEKNRRLLEKTLKDAMKPDRAKTKVLRISAFGIVELTRQRLGPSLKQSYFNRCVRCDGLGVVQSEESLSLKIMREVQRASADANVAHIEAVVPPEVAHFLLNRQRIEIARVEAETGKTVVIRADAEIGAGKGTVHCTNSRGAPVAWEHPAVGKPQPTKLQTIPISQVPPPPPPAQPEVEAQPAGTAAAGPPAAAPAELADHGGIDFDEIEADPIPYLDDEDAELDRMISATDLADQDESDAALRAPAVDELPVKPAAASAAVQPAGPEGLDGLAGELKKKRRSRRGGRKHRRHRDGAPEGVQAPADQPPVQAQGEPGQAPAQAQAASSQAGQPRQQRQQQQQPRPAGDRGRAPQVGEEGAVKKKRRRRHRHKSHNGEPVGAADRQPQAQPAAQRQPQPPAPQEPGEGKSTAQQPAPAQPAGPVQAQAQQPAKPAPVQQPAQQPPQPAPGKPATEAKPPVGPAPACKPRRPRPPRRKKSAAKSAQGPAGPAAQTPPAGTGGEKPSGGAQAGTAESARPAAKRPRRRRAKKAAPAAGLPPADAGPGKTDSPA
jgi:ribonuclease E